MGGGRAPGECLWGGGYKSGTFQKPQPLGLWKRRAATGPESGKNQSDSKGTKKRLCDLFAAAP